VRGADNLVYWQSYSSTGWRGTWSSVDVRRNVATVPRPSGVAMIPGSATQFVATSAPAVASQTGGSLDVVVRGPDDAFWRKSYTMLTGWSPWRSCGGSFSSKPSLTWSANNLVIFGRGVDRSVYRAEGTCN
jgi:hypothetical protein